MILTIQEDEETGDLYIEIPDELIEEVGWQIGDNISWVKRDESSWYLEKVDGEDNI